MKGIIDIPLFQIKVDDIIISVIFTISILMEPVCDCWEVNKGALVLHIQPDQAVLVSLRSWEITRISLGWGSCLCLLPTCCPRALCSPVCPVPESLRADPSCFRGKTPGTWWQRVVVWLCLCGWLIPKARLPLSVHTLLLAVGLLCSPAQSFWLFLLPLSLCTLSGFLLCVLLCFLMKQWQRKSLWTLQVAS